MTGPAADVAIVGFGPVGAALSVLLAQRGHRVVALERWPEPYPLPRAVHLDHEVARILQSCGIGDELRAMTEPADVYEWRNAAGTTLLRFGRVGASASGWPASSMFHQPELEAALARRAAELDVVVRRGVEVVGLVQDAAGVTLRTRDGGDVRARVVVGCDGANSTVRTLVGAPVEDRGFFYDWLIVDVVLHEPRVFDPQNLQVCDPARPTTVVSGGPGRRRWEFMRLPHEDRAALDDPAQAWELLAAWDVHPGNARLERHAVYTFNARYVTRWRTGRVLLAGDAAHQMPPFAGQGMCSGIRDAANLAWKLDLVLTDRAHDSLLDTYESERRPHVAQAIAVSMELGKVICIPDPDEAAARDAAMAPHVGPEPSAVPPMPPITDGLVHPRSDQAGTLAVQGTIAGRLADDVVGAGWRLLTIERGTDLDPDAVAWFESLGGRVVELHEPDEVHARWFGAHGVAWALQRPDFHLYGTAVDAPAATSLLTDLRAHLADPATVPLAPAERSST